MGAELELCRGCVDSSVTVGTFNCLSTLGLPSHFVQCVTLLLLCLDEFLRSWVSQQYIRNQTSTVHTLNVTHFAGERLFMFEGRNLSINNSLAIFITMNPMYEFRSVLPSNLKVR